MRVVFAVLIVVAALAAPAGAQGTRAARQALDDCAVMIVIKSAGNVGPTWFGTGFIVGGGRMLATNYHVAGQDTVGGMEREARGQLQMVCSTRKGPLDAPLRQDDSWYQDLSLIAIATAPVPGISAARNFSSLQPGEPVFTLGNPHGQSWTLSTGRIAEILGEADDSPQERKLLHEIESTLSKDGARYRRHQYSRMILVGAGFAQPGNSGGAVVDSEGRLVGVVFALILGKDGEERSLVIPAEYLPMMSNGVRLSFTGRPRAAKESPAPPTASVPSTVRKRAESLAATIAREDPDAPRNPGKSSWLVRHLPLDDTARQVVAAHLERAVPDDAAQREAILSRTREFWLTPDEMLKVRDAKVAGIAAKLAVWSEGEPPAIKNPGSLMWFYTKVRGMPRVFATLPPGCDATTQLSLTQEEGSEITVWPE